MAILGAILAAAAPAHAQGGRHSITLSYASADDSCPSEATFRARVAARLGYDPFGQSVGPVVTVAFRSESAGYVVSITSGDAILRTLRAKSCTQVAFAAELVVALAIDPLSTGVAPASGRASTPSSTPAFAVVPHGGAVSSATSPSPASAGPVTFGATLGVGGVVGEMPVVGAVMAIGLQAARDDIAFGLELRFDPPTTRLAAVGAVDTSVALATGLACMADDQVLGCALLGAGSYRVTPTGIAGGQVASSSLAEAGLRVAWCAPLTARLSLSPHLDVLVPFVKTVLRSDGANLWTSPPVAALIAIELGWRLW